jgi:NAD(P)-dependent dehydrogenase (short-subunit alcohol dehydrogenase family)
VLTTDPADWDAVFRTNVGGTWLWSRAAVPEMQRQGNGSIITLASQLAIAGGKGNSAYIAAKGAIISLTRTMALDFATDGIRVNAIAPGWFPSEMNEELFADERTQRWLTRQCPMGRSGRIDELDGKISRIRCYCFAPDTLAAIAEEIGVPAHRKPYRSP